MHIFLSREVRIPSSISVVAGGIHSLGSYVTAEGSHCPENLHSRY